jgi:hypothetical protein
MEKFLFLLLLLLLIHFLFLPPYSGNVYLGGDSSVNLVWLMYFLYVTFFFEGQWPSPNVSQPSLPLP